MFLVTRKRFLKYWVVETVVCTSWVLVWLVYLASVRFPGMRSLMGLFVARCNYPCWSFFLNSCILILLLKVITWLMRRELYQWYLSLHVLQISQKSSKRRSKWVFIHDGNGIVLIHSVIHMDINYPTGHVSTASMWRDLRLSQFPRNS